MEVCGALPFWLAKLADELFIWLASALACEAVFVAGLTALGEGADELPLKAGKAAVLFGFSAG